MDTEVKKWGNSYAIRLPKREAERLGLREGDRVEVDVRKAKRRRSRARADLSAWPVFHDGRADVSEKHDDVLYGGRA